MKQAKSSAAIEVRVPTLPESVSDATLVVWHKHPGDAVKRDENLLDIETDKVVFEVPAPADGVLQEVLKQDGATVLSQELLARIQPRGNGAAHTSAPVVPAKGASPQKSAPIAPPMSPAVRRLVSEHALRPELITGTGKHGRLTKADVLAHMERQAPPPASAEAPTVIAPRPSPGIADARGERRVPMSRLRARIAERMLEAQQSAAILTTFNEVNLQALGEVRKRHQQRFQELHGVKLGWMSFFIKASIEALKRFPVLNASTDDNDILYHDYYDIGVAIGSPRGLVVPVLRNVDQLGFAQIESAIADFANRAKDGSLNIEELAGGTFTITNGGVFGSMLSTPILNPPQSAILGMHKIQERPMAEDGQVVVRPMMYIALSYDHRIIDGREAVQFLVAIKEQLEDPTRLLLEV